MKTRSKTLTATELKTKCFEILDHLQPSGLIITKHGPAVARITPIVDNSKFIGSMKGKVKILGDLFSTGERWEAGS